MFKPLPYPVVIIDDDKFHGQILEELCARHDWVQAKIFHDPNLAIDYITEQQVRIVLIDINMPGMYGDDLLRQCMNLRQGIQAYIITGTENMAIVDRCLNIGARIIIRKPVSQEAIDEALVDARSHLDRCRSTILSFARKKLESA